MRGLTVAPAKSAIWAPTSFSLLANVQLATTLATLQTWASAHQIPIVNLDAQDERRGFLVGGLPIGSPAFIEAFLRSATAEAQNLVRTVVAKYEEWPMVIGFPTLHGLYIVLQRCVGSKLTHVLRGLPPTLTRPHMSNMDATQLNGFLVLIGRHDLVALPRHEWQHPLLQALRQRVFLWLDAGGMGIPELSRIAPFAFVGSHMLIGKRLRDAVALDSLAPEALALVTTELDAALSEARDAGLIDSVAEKLPPSAVDLLRASQETKGGQFLLSRAQEGHLHARIWANLPPNSQARAIWLSARAPEAGAGLGALPLEKDLGLDDDTFRDEVCFRLGIATPWFVALPSQFPCPLSCRQQPGQQLSPNHFWHPLVCARAGTGQRHLPVVTALTVELDNGLTPRGAHVDSRRTGYLEHGLVARQQHIQSTSARDIAQDKADIAITQVGCRPILLDPTVVTPTVTSSTAAANKAGTTVRKAEQDKDKELQRRFVVPDPSPIDFRGLGIETFGRFGPNMDSFLSYAARRAFPPRTTSEGKDWDVDGQMARFTGRLRARVQIGRALGCQAQLAKFRSASAHLAVPVAIQLRPVTNNVISLM